MAKLTEAQQQDLLSRLRTGLMASAAFVRHNPDRDRRVNDALNAIDLVGEVIFALRQYVTCQSRMREKWAEGDDNVKQGLWRSLHELEEPTRELIERISGRSALAEDSKSGSDG